LNNKKQILIDCCYLNSPGGKRILIDLLNKLQANNSNDLFLILIDFRSKNLKKIFSKIKFKIISNNEYSRALFYKQNKQFFYNILCLSNVPPPIKLKAKVYIFFHNNILLSSKNLDLNLKTRLIFYLKKKYILCINNKKFKWIVQNDLMKNNLSDKFKISKEQIKVYPVFENLKNKNLNRSNSFIYPTTISKHKNNLRLLKAFVQSADQTPDLSFNLKITISQTSETEKVLINAPKNLTVDFLGSLSREDTIDEISKSKFLIFPSLTESFGLPIIEGCQLGCYVICSDLPYVHEIIRPSLTFDPYSVKSISKMINQSLQDKNLIFTQMKIESATQLILNEITHV
jgi:glycosyltransferase involved in cell wall biosynthesis